VSQLVITFYEVQREMKSIIDTLTAVSHSKVLFVSSLYGTCFRGEDYPQA